MIKLSACVIVKNEEKNLPQWLSSMKKIADEMIVVDTGSIDCTIEMAKAAGAKVYDFAWRDDFAAAKNFALSKAMGDWIVFLDADEYFTEETVNNLLPYLEMMHENKKVDAFLSRMVNVDADDNNRLINVIQNVRVFRRRQDLRFMGAVHEFLVRTGGPLRIMPMEAEVEIYHTGYSHNIIEGKLERNLKLLRQDMDEHGEKPWHYAYLADCYYGLKKYDEAIYYAKRGIEAKVVALGQESTIYRRLIDSIALSGKDKQELMQAIQLAVSKFPHMPEFIWNKGEVLFEQRDYLGAEKYLHQAVQLQTEQQGNEAEGTFAGRVNLVYCTLGKLAVLKNDIPQALEYYTHSLQIYRYNEIAMRGLYGLLRQQDPADVLLLLQSIYDTSKRDMQFIAKALSMYKTDKIYLYYLQKLQEKYKIQADDVAAAGLFAAEKYSRAAEQAMAAIKDDAIFIILSMLQEYDETKRQVMALLLPPMYLAIMDRCLGKNVELEDDCLEIYKKIERLRRVRNSTEQGNEVVNGAGAMGTGDHITSIIIAVCNHFQETKQCIESIQRQTKEAYEIIVVDNHSVDDTAEWLQQQTDIKVITNSLNEGFIKAVNQGISIATGDEVLVLHNDTAVSGNWLKNLRAALYSDDRIGAVGPVSYGTKQEQQPEITEKYQDISGMQLVAAKIAATATVRWQQALSLDSFCMLFKRKAVDEVGLLDEQFSPRYYEDMDYAFRVIKAGYRLLLSKEVFVHHTNGVTSRELGEKRQKIYGENLIKFKQKWGFSPHYSCGIRRDLLSAMDLKKENLTVLDVGCACGGNLMYIKEVNPLADVYGVELNDRAAELAACFGSISNCNIERAESLNWQKKFDYIIMGDILEHLNDPLQTLKNLKTFLKPDGCVAASIPNVMHISVIADLLQGNWTYEDAGILDKTHLRFFTKMEITKMFAAAGLSVLTLGYHIIPTTQEQESLKERILQMPEVKADEEQFSAYQWLVLAQNNVFVQHKTIFIEMMRNIEAQEQSILAFFESEEIDFSIVYDWIKEALGELKVKTLVDLAVLLYKNGKMEAALKLMCTAYEKNQDNADIIYAFAFLLHLYGDDAGAEKVISNAEEMTEELRNLQQEMDKLNDAKS